MLLLREQSDFDPNCLYMFLKAFRQATKQRTFYTMVLSSVDTWITAYIKPVSGCEGCCHKQTQLNVN